MSVIPAGLVKEPESSTVSPSSASVHSPAKTSMFGILETVAMSVSSPSARPPSPNPVILNWTMYGESLSSSYLWWTVAVTLRSPSPVGAVRLPDTTCDPSPKSHV